VVLNLSYPKNPKQIVIRNKFYPKGLTEGQIYNYYQDTKYQLLQQVRNRDVSLWIGVELNKLVIRKNIRNKPIRLNSSNYDTVLTGRTISIHSSMGMYEDISIIDIDTDNFKEAKFATLQVYQFALEKIPIINEAKIIFTGKTSFHIHLKFAKKMNINIIRNLLRKYLLESDLMRQYTVSAKRTKGIVNLDLSSNKFKGNFITPYSLSIIGLRSIILRPNELMSFQIGRTVI